MVKAALVKDLIDYLGLTINSFEQEIGVGSGTLYKAIRSDSDLSPLLFQKISKRYDNISPIWLQTGKPPIFLQPNVNQTVEDNQPKIEQNNSVNSHYTKNQKDMIIELQAKALADNAESHKNNSATIMELSSSLIALMREQVELMKMFKNTQDQYPKAMAG